MTKEVTREDFDEVMTRAMDAVDDIAREVEARERRGVPAAWQQIPTDSRPAKTRVTIRIDDDVLAWFRGMGPGWQTRTNAVLRTFWEEHRNGDKPNGWRSDG